jgi:hypothetical protein
MGKMPYHKLMEKIEDFEFIEHRAGFQARKLFDNGYGLSILPESDGLTYEIAILAHKDGKRPHLCYDSGLTTDVFRYMGAYEARDLIKQVQELPNRCD